MPKVYLVLETWDNCEVFEDYRNETRVIDVASSYFTTLMIAQKRKNTIIGSFGNSVIVTDIDVDPCTLFSVLIVTDHEIEGYPEEKCQEMNKYYWSIHEFELKKAP